MKTQQYEELYERWLNKEPNQRFWTNELAIEFESPSTEALRSNLRRYRENLGEQKNGARVKYKVDAGGAKICIFDLEFAPMVAYTFDLWDTTIGIDQILDHPYMLSWSAKMLNEPRIFSDVLTQKEALASDDLRITKSIREFLSQCQIVIGQNIKGFDLKKLNTRMLFHNLPPLPRFQVVDTLIAARKEFAFSSNSLKYMNQFLGIRQKMENEGFMLWRKCMQGDKNALNTMDEYCRGDVVATEDLYFKLRPYITGHPNLALYFNDIEFRCPNCGSTELENEGDYYTPSGRWNSLRCNECGSLSRGKYNHLTTQKRKSLKVN